MMPGPGSGKDAREMLADASCAICGKPAEHIACGWGLCERCKAGDYETVEFTEAKRSLQSGGSVLVRKLILKAMKGEE